MALTSVVRIAVGLRLGVGVTGSRRTASNWPSPSITRPISCGRSAYAND